MTDSSLTINIIAYYLLHKYYSVLHFIHNVVKNSNKEEMNQTISVMNEYHYHPGIETSIQI